MRSFFIFALLAVTVPTLAQTPPPADTAAPATASAPATTTPPAPASGPLAAALDGLIGKPQILGLTKQDGTRYLCRIVSGDHGQYVVQTFHFAGPPKTTTETTTAPATPPKPQMKTVTVGSGRQRQRVRVQVYPPAAPGTPRKVQVKTPTALPDDEAVRLLLAGVAGAIRTPEEVAGTTEILSPADVKYLQALSPPAKGKTGAWTMTTLWAGDKTTTAPSGTTPVKKSSSKKGKRKTAIPAPSAAPTTP